MRCSSLPRKPTREIYLHVTECTYYIRILWKIVIITASPLNIHHTCTSIHSTKVLKKLSKETSHKINILAYYIQVPRRKNGSETRGFYENSLITRKFFESLRIHFFKVHLSSLNHNIIQCLFKSWLKFTREEKLQSKQSQRRDAGCLKMTKTRFNLSHNYLYWEKKAPKSLVQMSYMTLMQTFVVLTLNELIYYLQSTISYVPSLYTPWDVMTSIALSMISINMCLEDF